MTRRGGFLYRGVAPQYLSRLLLLGLFGLTAVLRSRLVVLPAVRPYWMAAAPELKLTHVAGVPVRRPGGVSTSGAPAPASASGAWPS
jgi:hypothetical protein